MIALAQYESNQSKAPHATLPGQSGARRDPALKLSVSGTAFEKPRMSSQRASAAEHALRVALDRLIDAAAAELRADQIIRSHPNKHSR